MHLIKPKVIQLEFREFEIHHDTVMARSMERDSTRYEYDLRYEGSDRIKLIGQLELLLAALSKIGQVNGFPSG